MYYHGTNRPNEILAKGFDMDAPRRCDPGDFGWGIYLTKKLSRAKGFGTVLQVEVDLSRFALIPNPYFLGKNCSHLLPSTPEEHLFYDCVFFEGSDSVLMRTINTQGAERDAHAKEVRRIFLAAGYTGIRTRMYDNELVIFDTTVVRSVEVYQPGSKGIISRKVSQPYSLR